MLIEAGANVNAREKYHQYEEDEQGNTALMYALERGHTEIAQLLIDAGAKEY